jgi:hypothetical protein
MVTVVPGRTVLHDFLSRNPDVIPLKMLVTGEGDFFSLKPEGLDMK